MIIPVTVLALAWFIAVNHLHVRRYRAGKRVGIIHELLRESSAFLFRFVVAGAIFSALSLFLSGLNTDRTTLHTLLALDRALETCRDIFKALRLTPATTFFVLLLLYAISLLRSQPSLTLPRRFLKAREGLTALHALLVALTFFTFFGSRVGDPFLDPTGRIRHIREGFGAYREELAQTIAREAGDRLAQRLTDSVPELRPILAQSAAIRSSRDTLVARYDSASRASGIRDSVFEPMRASWAAIDSSPQPGVAGSWGGLEGGVPPPNPPEGPTGRGPTSDAGFGWTRSREAPDLNNISSAAQRVPQSVTVDEIDDAREALAKERARQAREAVNRRTVFQDAARELSSAALSMLFSGWAEPSVESVLNQRLGNLAESDPTVRFLPELVLEAVMRRCKQILTQRVDQITSAPPFPDEERLTEAVRESAESVAEGSEPPRLDPSTNRDVASELARQQKELQSARSAVRRAITEAAQRDQEQEKAEHRASLRELIRRLANGRRSPTEPIAEGCICETTYYENGAPVRVVRIPIPIGAPCGSETCTRFHTP